MGVFDDLIPGNEQPSSGLGGGAFDDLIPKKKQNKGILSDIGTDLKRGVEQMPGTATGLFDIPVAAITGKPYVGQAADAIGDITGFKPSQWAKDAESEYSPARQTAKANVDKAWETGGAKDIAKAYVQNPQQILGSVVESIPSIVAGGAVGKGISVAGKIAPVIAGAAGEGAVMAGQQMDQLSQTDADPRTAAAAAAATGILGGVIGAAGGKVAQKMGVVDPETAIAGGAIRATQEASGSGIKATAKDAAKRMAGGFISEGMFEELPQSALEQALSNLAQGKAWDEGMARAAVEGALAGGVMGAGANIPPGRPAVNVNAKPQDEQKGANPLLALPAPTYTGTPGDQIIAGDVDRQAAIDAAEYNNESLWDQRNSYEFFQDYLKKRKVNLVTDPAPIQQRLDALHGINPERLTGIARANYEKAVDNAFNETVGYVVGADGLEVPFTMGDYLKSSVRAADITRDRPKAEAANAAASARMDGLSSEETTQQPDIQPSIPVIGPLSKVANMAVQSGAVAETQMQQAMRKAVAKSADAAPAEKAPESVQISQPQQAKSDTLAPTQNANPDAGQFDVSGRNDSQIAYLALHGKPGWKESAIAEIQKRGNQPPVETPAVEKKPAKPVEQWNAEEIQARLDRGNLTANSEKKLRDLLAKKQPAKAPEAKTEKPITVGHAPGDAQPVTVRNGVIHIGNEPAVDYETEQDVTVHEGATPQQIADALKASGALGKRKVFGVTPMPQMAKAKETKAQSNELPPNFSPDVQYAKRPDGSYKTKNEYTPEEWAAYTKSVIDKKLPEAAPGQSAPQSDQGANHGQGQKAEVLNKTGAEKKSAPVEDSIGWSRMTAVEREALVARAGWSGKIRGMNLGGVRVASQAWDAMTDATRAKLVAANKNTINSIDSAANKAATSTKNDTPQPTDAQQEAGNYKKGHITVQGLNITIENPEGSKRSGTDEDGKAWEVTMAAHYGYIKSTEGNDGDHVDVYVGNYPDSDIAFIVDQSNADGSFDEHKVLLGFANALSATRAYAKSYEPGWMARRVIAAEKLTVSELKEWLKNGDMSKPYSSKKADQPSAETVTAPEESEASPQHVENGKAETATAAVVEQSLKKGAANSSLDLRQERDLLLKKIDAAIAAAPTAAEKDAWDSVNQKIDLKNNMHVEDTIGYRGFEVPGDGKFKVLNIKEALQRFRDRVESNPGFKKPANTTGLQKVAPWQRTTSGGTEAMTKELLEDGDYSAAVEYAKQIGKPLVFGQYQDGSVITVYTEAKPFEREGYDDFKMVSARNPQGSDKVAWAVIDLNSGLTISSQHPTRLKAIAETNKALEKMTPEQLATGIKSAKANNSWLVGTQEELEARWLENVDKREAEAQAKADQEHRRTIRPAKNGMLADTSVGKNASKQADDQLASDIAEGVKSANNPARQAAVMADIEKKAGASSTVDSKNEPKSESDKESTPQVVGGAMFNQARNADKVESFNKDIAVMRDYAFKFDIGDKVESDGKRYIVADKYIQDGEARYTVYPPGKKASKAYHVWIRESELQGEANPAEQKAGTADAGEELTYNKRNRRAGGVKWDDIKDKNAALRVKEVNKAKLNERAQSAEKAAQQAKDSDKTDSINGFVDGKTPMQAGAIRKALNKEYRFDGVVRTVRQQVEWLESNGKLMVSTIEEPKIKPMDRRAFNRASQREQDAHEKKMREAGMKTTYLVGESEIGKTAYDYAEYLIAKRDASTADSKNNQKYSGPADVSSRAGQMEMANRAGTIAALKAMNNQLRQIAPDEAWADSNIEDSADLDSLRDKISQALVDAQRQGAGEVDPLRKTLQEMSGQEIKSVFDKMGLAGKFLGHSERVQMLLAEDANEVLAAIAEVVPNDAVDSKKTERGTAVYNTAGNDALSPADKAIYGMVAEGKSAADILKFIASASRNPMNRQLAKLLMKTGIAPRIMASTTEGWTFNAGNDKKYAAAYNPKTDTIALFRPAASERNFLHEAMHAATLRALGKKGMAAGQMKVLFAHVEKSGALKGMYGMSDIDEFVAEAFTNPKFQEALKKVSAPKSASSLSSAWHWFVRIVRGILGLPANQENALSQAIEIGLGVMREDMKLRNGMATDPRLFVQAAQITGKEVERTLGRTIQEKATNWMRANLQGKSFRNDATGWDISVGRKGINKTMNHGAKELHARSVAALPGLLKNAVLVSSEPARHAADNMDVFAVHNFYAPFSIAGEMHIARMVVKETRSGQKFYDYDTSDVISPTNQAADAHLPKEGAAAQSAGPNMSMAILLSHVKKEHGGTDPRFVRYAEWNSRSIEFRSDVPNEEWLKDNVDYARAKGRNKFGVPFMGKTTGYFRGSRPMVSVDLLAKIDGEMGEQGNVRNDDLDWLKNELRNNGLENTGVPYIEVGYDGVPWVSEGNHRIMAAKALGWKTMPVEVRYFDGGERIDGLMNPDRIMAKQDDGAIRYNVSDDAWSVSEPSKMDDVIYALQDKQIDLKRVIQSISSTGKKIRDNFNAYLQEELFHGRAAKGVKDFLDFELRPMLAEMNSSGVDIGDFEEYLWNRHAEERNKQIAKVNPDLNEPGSGISTADARAYLAGLSPEQKAKYESLAKRIDAINASSQGILVNSGLETQETINAWNGAYKHYVPLQREDVDSGHTGTGKGFSVRGSATKRAMGSGRKVVDIIANIAQQRERNIVRAEKNRVSNALMGLALENPNPDFWKVDQAPKERFVENRAIYSVIDADGNKIDEFTRMDDADKLAGKTPGASVEQTWGDRVSERVEPGFKNRDNVLLTRVNGQDHYIVFNERDDRAMRMAMAMKNLDVDNLGRVLSLVGKATRYLASINTQYNPIFGVINLIRDAQGALINLSSTPLAGDQKRVLGYTKDALVGIYKDIRAHRAGKKPSSNWAELFEEFQKEGGQTGYRDQYANAEARAEEIKAELEQFKEGNAKRLARSVFGWLSDYNETMENAVRLASYKAAKEKGMSNQQAASLAKNITVNFNRKGQMATQVGALYAFFNASVQGTARIAETLFEQHGGDFKNVRLSSVGKKIIAGGVMLGSMQALLLASAGYDDDEPPEFIRERNLILPIGDGKYLTLAMPLGFHVIPGIGRIATEFVMSGGKDPAKRTIDFLSMFTEAFNPVGSSGISIQTLTPSVVDPFAALAENKDFTGREIYRENFNANDPSPGNARAKDVATIWSRFIAEVINRGSGGTEFKPGAFSPSPDAIDYLIAQVTGGVGREVNKAAQTVGAAYSGDDLPLYKVPLVGRFVGDTEGQSGQSQKFYNAVREINQHEREIKGLREAGRLDEAREYMAENPVYRMAMMANHTENQVRKLRDVRRKASDEGDSGKVRAINEQITGLMTKFNERAAPLLEQ